jgi:fatty-acid desaturase
LKLGIDEKIIVFVTLVVGLFTQLFAGIGALIAMIPFIGPLIVKVFAIPFFWLLNALGYFVGVIAIKRGYSSEFMRSRVLTVALLVGIVVGYIIGHIIPLR